MVLHIVLYEPRQDLSEETVSSFKGLIFDTARQIHSVRQVKLGRTVDFGIGYQNGPSDQRFSYVAIFEFESESDLKAYLGHPAHAPLAEQFWKYCERTMILDVEAEDLMGHALLAGPNQKKLRQQFP